MKVNKSELDRLTDIPLSRYDKHKSICEFILLCIKKMYDYDDVLEVLSGDGRKVKYQEARKILFYLVKQNTGFTFGEIAKQLPPSKRENIWKDYRYILEIKKTKIKNDTMHRVDLIQSRLDEYIKKLESNNN